MCPVLTQRTQIIYFIYFATGHLPSSNRIWLQLNQRTWDKSLHYLLLRDFECSPCPLPKVSAVKTPRDAKTHSWEHQPGPSNSVSTSQKAGVFTPFPQLQRSQRSMQKARTLVSRSSSPSCSSPRSASPRQPHLPAPTATGGFPARRSSPWSCHRVAEQISAARTSHRPSTSRSHNSWFLQCSWERLALLPRDGAAATAPLSPHERGRSCGAVTRLPAGLTRPTSLLAGTKADSRRQPDRCRDPLGTSLRRGESPPTHSPQPRRGRFAADGWGGEERRPARGTHRCRSCRKRPAGGWGRKCKPPPPSPAGSSRRGTRRGSSATPSCFPPRGASSLLRSGRAAARSAGFTLAFLTPRPTPRTTPVAGSGSAALARRAGASLRARQVRGCQRLRDERRLRGAELRCAAPGRGAEL